MKKILITELSKQVLTEIASTSWCKKRKDTLRCRGIRPILQHFEEKGILYYDEETAKNFTVQVYNQYLAGKCRKDSWQTIRKCSAFMLQVFNSGHISIEPLTQ